eukprot:gb/GECG01008838.1/.p1 GENE.gb/GECG01008838.1/~~gb/GECG01008838.1/.p1  ORF type:complete len:716 (+),score=101.87 gb/GECG01008838.1/:1-2148(+)
MGDTKVSFGEFPSINIEGSTWVLYDKAEVMVEKSSSAEVSLGDLTQYDESHIKSGHGSNVTIEKAWSLLNASKLTLEGHNHFVLGNLFVSEDSVMTGKGNGFGECSGPGKPSDRSHRGASHGGLGTLESVEKFIQKENKMAAYDDVFLPQWAGSGGCDPNNGGDGGSGGAYLDLRVQQSSEIRGTIDLSGSDAKGTSRFVDGEGGGSGGGLLFRTDILRDSTGTLLVNGGKGRNPSRDPLGYGGGGGRIALYCNSVLNTEDGANSEDSHRLTVQAYGGDIIDFEGHRSGPGTFYHECGGNASSRHLIVDNGEVSFSSSEIGYSILIASTPSLWIDVVAVTNSVLHISPSSEEGERGVNLVSIRGEKNGKIEFGERVVAVLGMSSEKFSLKDNKISVQMLPHGERIWRSTATFYTDTLLLTEIDLVFSKGSKGILPPNVFVCGHTITNNGRLLGVSNITFCPSDDHGEILGSQQIEGCTHPQFDNFNPLATLDDGSCSNNNLTWGCTYSVAMNYDPVASVNDGSCSLPRDLDEGCPCIEATNFNPSVELFDGSCIYPTQGCTYPAAWNYQREAQWDDGSCDFGPLGEIGRAVNSLEDKVRKLEEQLAAERQKNKQLEDEKEELANEKGKQEENCSREMEKLEIENTDIKEEKRHLQESLDECESKKVGNNNEKQRFQTLLRQCRQQRRGCNATGGQSRSTFSQKVQNAPRSVTAPR